ncbi:hypothetical protein THRCLA_03818, partial [Thraustotheca clavata]
MILIEDGKFAMAHRFLNYFNELRNPLGDFPYMFDIDIVACHGDLKLIQKLHVRGLGRATSKAMDKAENGYCAIVQFLHEHRSEGCTINGIEKSWKTRHFEIVDYLETHYPLYKRYQHWQRIVHNWNHISRTLTIFWRTSCNSLLELTMRKRILFLKRSAFCTLLEQPDLFNIITSYQNGLPYDLAVACRWQLQVLHALYFHLNPWLAQYREKPVFYCRVMLKLIEEGHFATAHRFLKCVSEFRNPQGDFPYLFAIDTAARQGDLALIKELHQRGLGRASSKAMDEAAGKGRFAIVQYLQEHRSEGCTIEGIEKAWKGRHFEIVDYLEVHYPQFECKKKRHWQHVVHDWSKKAINLIPKAH